MKPDRPAHVLNIRKQSGWHILVEINEQEITFLVDSGASCTMIDASIYQNSTKSVPLQLSPTADTFVLADGSQLEVLGGDCVGRSHRGSVVSYDLGRGRVWRQYCHFRTRLYGGSRCNFEIVTWQDDDWKCIDKMQKKVVIALAWAIPWLFLQDQ